MTPDLDDQTCCGPPHSPPPPPSTSHSHSSTPTQNSRPADASATDEIPPRFVAGKSFTSPRGQSYDVNPCAQESGRLDVSVKAPLGVPLICPGCTTRVEHLTLSLFASGSRTVCVKHANEHGDVAECPLHLPAVARPDSTVWDLSQLHLDDQKRVVELQDDHMPKDDATQAKKHALISTCVGLQRKPTQYEKIDWKALAEAFLPDLVPHLLNTQEDGTPRAYFADPLTSVWSEMSTDGNTATTPLYRMIQTLLQELTTLSRTITERDVVGWKAVHAALNTRLCHEALWLSPREEMDDPIELLHKRDRDGDRFDRICETVLLHRVREFERHIHNKDAAAELFKCVCDMLPAMRRQEFTRTINPPWTVAIDTGTQMLHLDVRGGAFRLEPLRAEHRHIASIRLRLPPHDEFERICQIYCEEFDQFRTLAEHRRGPYQKETTWSLAQTKAVDRLCDAFPPAHRAQLRLLIESQTNQFEGPGGMVDNLTAFSRALFGDYRAAMAVIYTGPRQKSDNTQAGDGGKSYGEAVRKRIFDGVAHRTDTYSAVMDLSTIAEKGTRAAGGTTDLKNLDLKRCAQVNECKPGQS